MTLHTTMSTFNENFLAKRKVQNFFKYFNFFAFVTIVTLDKPTDVFHFIYSYNFAIDKTSHKYSKNQNYLG